MLFNTKDIHPQDIYTLLVGSVMPRPIAWVGSLDENGVANLAPYSFFTVASVNPPVIAITMSNKEQGTNKDSLINIKKSQCFSVSMVSHENAEAMSMTAGLYAPEVNEFDVAGLTQIPCNTINSVRCEEAQVSFECTLLELKSFGDQLGAGNLVLANVVAINVDDNVIDGYKIDSSKIDLVGRLAGAKYTKTRDTFEIQRPE